MLRFPEASPIFLSISFSFPLCRCDSGESAIVSPSMSLHLLCCPSLDALLAMLTICDIKPDSQEAETESHLPTLASLTSDSVSKTCQRLPSMERVDAAPVADGEAETEEIDEISLEMKELERQLKVFDDLITGIREVTEQCQNLGWAASAADAREQVSFLPCKRAFGSVQEADDLEDTGSSKATERFTKVCKQSDKESEVHQLSSPKHHDEDVDDSFSSIALSSDIGTDSSMSRGQLECSSVPGDLSEYVGGSASPLLSPSSAQVGHFQQSARQRAPVGRSSNSWLAFGYGFTLGVLAMYVFVFVNEIAYDGPYVEMVEAKVEMALRLLSEVSLHFQVMNTAQNFSLLGDGAVCVHPFIMH